MDRKIPPADHFRRAILSSSWAMLLRGGRLLSLLKQASKPCPRPAGPQVSTYSPNGTRPTRRRFARGRLPKDQTGCPRPSSGSRTIASPQKQRILIGRQIGVRARDPTGKAQFSPRLAPDFDGNPRNWYLNPHQRKVSFMPLARFRALTRLSAIGLWLPEFPERNGPNCRVAGPPSPSRAQCSPVAARARCLPTPRASLLPYLSIRQRGHLPAPMGGTNSDLAHPPLVYHRGPKRERGWVSRSAASGGVSHPRCRHGSQMLRCFPRPRQRGPRHRGRPQNLRGGAGETSRS